MTKEREAVKMSSIVLDDSGGGRTAWQRELKDPQYNGSGNQCRSGKEQLGAAMCSLSQLTALMGWL